MGRFSQILNPAPKRAKVEAKSQDGPLIAPVLARPLEEQPTQISKLEPKPETASKMGMDWLDAKMRIHSRLIDEVDLSALDELSDEDLRKQVYGAVASLVREEKLVMNSTEVEKFSSEVFDQ